MKNYNQVDGHRFKKIKNSKKGSHMQTTVELQKLFGLSRVGKVKQWQAFVEENENGTATMIVETGYVGQKIRPIPKIIKKGKNIAKSNETTPFAQAVSEAQSKWNGKRDENYELEMIDPNNYTPRLMLPMLAKKPGKGKIIYPCSVQPKFNGVCKLGERIVDPGGEDIIFLAEYFLNG